jgi:serine/threonine-protein kinase SRPK3
LKFQELAYLQKIRDQNPLHPGYLHVIQLLDHVHHNGPDGRHLGLVMELLGENLASLTGRFSKNHLSIPLVKRIIRQVGLGLDYLHDCKIVHTGTYKDFLAFLSLFIHIFL